MLARSLVHSHPTTRDASRTTAAGPSLSSSRHIAPAHNALLWHHDPRRTAHRLPSSGYYHYRLRPRPAARPTPTWLSLHLVPAPTSPPSRTCLRCIHAPLASHLDTTTMLPAIHGNPRTPTILSISLSLLALTSIDNPRPRLFYSIYLATLCARITHDHGNPRTPTILSISLGPRISTSRQPSRPAILSIYLAALRPASHDLCARISHGPRLSRHHGNPRAPTILSRPSPLSTSRLLQAPSRLSLFRASSPPSTSYRPPILSIVHLSIYRPTSLSLSLYLSLYRAPLSLSLLSFFRSRTLR